MKKIFLALVASLFSVLATAGGPFNQYSPAAGVQFNATGNTPTNTAATGANFASLFNCAAKDVVYSSATNSITCDSATHALTFDPTGGSFGTGLLTVSDTFNIHEPVGPSTWVTFDPSVGLTIDLTATGNSLVYQVQGGTISWHGDQSTIWNMTAAGDFIFTSGTSADDTSLQVSNANGNGSEYGDTAIGYTSNRTAACFISQNTIAVRLPSGTICPLTSTTLPMGGTYIGGKDNGTFSLFKGATGIEAIRILHSAGMTGDDVFVHSRTSIPTSAVDGFFYLENTAGVPSGTPTNVAAVNNTTPLIYDSTDHRLYAYASNWLNVADTPSSAFTLASAPSVANLPTCNAGATGRLMYVTDALAPAYNVNVVGGGAVVVPVFCNGANWTAH